MPAAPYTLALTGADDHAYFAQAQRAFGTPIHDDGTECSLRFPAWFGAGELRSVRLRDQMRLFIGDLQPRAPLVLDWQAEGMGSLLELHYHFAGSFTSSLSASPEAYLLGAGQVGLCYCDLPALQGQMRYPAQQRQIQLEVTIQAPALEQLGDWVAALLPPMRPAARPGLHLSTTAISPAAQAVLHQILHCPFVGGIRHLYLESKALELIALAAAAHVPLTASCRAAALRSDDVARIHAAKDVLIQRMEDPPSLLELARAVGLNDFKLKVGFKQVFGATVFGYLQAHRMEQARALLREGRLTVLEVALTVGYQSPSRFTAAFKRRFGVVPSSLLKHLSPPSHSFM